jgi:hypothetical protein
MASRVGIPTLGGTHAPVLASYVNGTQVRLQQDRMATELRVVAQHLQRDVLPRGPSHPRRLRLPADVLMRLRSGKG